MKIPEDIIKSLDLIDISERNKVNKAFDILEKLESDENARNNKVSKISYTDFFVFRTSSKYRIIFKWSEKNIEIIDIVNHNKFEKILNRHRGISK